MSTRRGNREGSIVRRGKRFWGRISLPQPDGTYRSVSVTRDSRKAVRDEFRSLLDRVDAGQPVIDSATPFAEWVDRWAAGALKASNRRSSTQDQYLSLLRNHAVPVLGDTPVGKVTASMVESMLVGTTVGASSRRSLYAALSACFATAVRDGLIARNPVVLVQRPSPPAKGSRTLSADQVKAIVKAAQGSRIQHFIVLLATTGLRRSEALGLRWSRVDLEAGHLTVDTALTRDSTGLHLGPPKSEAGLRAVSLPPMAVDALRRQRKAQVRDQLSAGAAWTDSGLVFTNEIGGALEPRNVSREYSKIAKAANAPDTGMHALRHYAATSWLHSGSATVRDVATALGHSSPSITLDVYVSPVPEATKAAMDQAAKAIGDGY